MCTIATIGKAVDKYWPMLELMQLILLMCNKQENDLLHSYQQIQLRSQINREIITTVWKLPRIILAEINHAHAVYKAMIVRSSVA